MSDKTGTAESSEEHEDNALEEKVREQMGVEQWDRPVIFRETAGAALDVGLPYWSILLISGAIAALGLALDNAAVVIGAMLIAPLLAPMMGLALALAVGDVRLAVQTSIIVVVSTVAVIFIAALLTLVLPFEAVTPQITARSRPTTLDLAIAVFSGLAGGVVSVTRSDRLSAAIPGVAIAVALIPPLAVAGFAIGAGGRWTLLWGSMLLYGANLAGIVFSGTLVFLMIGMHRSKVTTLAMRWHVEEATPTGLAAWTARTSWIRSLGMSETPLKRLGLVLILVAALAIPLTVTLFELARETRVEGAVNATAEMFDIPGRSSILSREVVLGDESSRVFIRVATTEWFGDEARETFERTASAQAKEPVNLVLEQLPTSAGDLEQLAELLPDQNGLDGTSQSSSSLPTLLAPAWEQIRRAVAALPMPEGARIVGADLQLSHPRHTQLRVGYVAERPLSADMQEVLAHQLTDGIAAPDLTVEFVYVPTDTQPLNGAAADSTRLQEIASFLERYEGLRAELIADTSRGTSRADTAASRLTRLGVPPERVVRRGDSQGGLRIQLEAAPQADWDIVSEEDN